MRKKNPSNEDAQFIDKYDKIVNRAHSEVDNVRKVYYWISGLIVFLLAVGSYIGYNSIKDMRTDMRNEIDRIKAEAEKRTELFKEELTFDRSRIEKEVRDRVEAEFDKDNIRVIVTNTAIDKVKNYSDKIIEETFNSKILPNINSMQRNINSFNASVSQTQELNIQQISNTKKELQNILQTYQNSLDSLKTSAAFISIVLSAQNDDRKAWEKLNELGKNKKYIYWKEAISAYNTIKDIYSNPSRDISVILDFSWPKEIPDSTITIINVNNVYNQLLHDNAEDSWYSRRSLIKYTYNKQSFSETDKMQFFIDVLNKDTSLSVAAYAGQLFAEHYKLDIKYLAIDYFR